MSADPRIRELDPLYLLDAQGQQAQVGELRAGRPTLLLLIRHFG
jgi:hypothetical protein